MLGGWGHIERCERGQNRLCVKKEECGIARQSKEVSRSVVRIYMIIGAVYLVLGILGYSNISGVGASVGKQAPTPLWRKVMVVVLWPLAMIGAIDT